MAETSANPIHEQETMIERIVSGGQTGADRAALDAAINVGLPHCGWIPKGRLTENGPLPEKYHLKEMPSSSYIKRTKQKVIDSDGTLILSHGKLRGVSLLTQEFAEYQINSAFTLICLKSLSSGQLSISLTGPRSKVPRC